MIMKQVVYMWYCSCTWMFDYAQSDSTKLFLHSSAEVGNFLCAYPDLFKVEFATVELI